MISLHATRGANYWSRTPITQMDLNIGEYENISSADVPGFTQSLVAAMPVKDAAAIRPLATEAENVAVMTVPVANPAGASADTIAPWLLLESFRRAWWQCP